MGEHGDDGKVTRYFAGKLFLVSWAINFLFPRLAYRLRWTSRLTGVPLSLFIAATTAQGTAMRYWLLPWIERQGEKQKAVREQLAIQLGRQPTDDEVFDHLMAEHDERR